MTPMTGNDQNGWDEITSELFIEYGNYFVPERERQIQIISDLIPDPDFEFTILEIACGEGLLAERVLADHPNCRLIGLDGSPEMLARAKNRLARFERRFKPEHFNLFDYSWRRPREIIHAVISSLAIHHLDGQQKKQLFQDVNRILAPGGVFIVADIISPASPPGWEVAASLWDDTVLTRSREIDQTQRAFEFFQNEHWNTFRYFDPNDIDKPSRLIDQLNWLESAGFSNIDVYWMLAGHAIFGGDKPPKKNPNKQN